MPTSGDHRKVWFHIWGLSVRYHPHNFIYHADFEVFSNVMWTVIVDINWRACLWWTYQGMMRKVCRRDYLYATIKLSRVGLILSPFTVKLWFSFFIRPSLGGTYYGMALSVRPSVRPSVRLLARKNIDANGGFCTQVCLGVRSINLLFVWSYHIKYAHNSIISDFSIFGIQRVIF